MTKIITLGISRLRKKEKLIKMKYFITSDIHGYYSVLIEELNKQGFDKNKDTLITLGDNFDRGPEN